jgi:hypothetical protein
MARLKPCPFDRPYPFDRLYTFDRPYSSYRPRSFGLQMLKYVLGEEVEGGVVGGGFVGACPEIEGAGLHGPVVGLGTPEA